MTWIKLLDKFIYVYSSSKESFLADFYLRNIPIIIMCLNEAIFIPTREIVSTRMASTKPSFLSYDLLCLIIHIVNRRLSSLSFFMCVSMENWYVSDAKTIDELIIIGYAVGTSINFKCKLCLPKSSFVVSESGIENIVIVADSWLGIGF